MMMKLSRPRASVSLCVLVAALFFPGPKQLWSQEHDGAGGLGLRGSRPVTEAKPSPHDLPLCPGQEDHPAVVQQGASASSSAEAAAGEDTSQQSQATRIVHVKGSLSKKQIGAVIRRYLNQFKYCYEKELSQQPALEGKVVALFVIAGDGQVIRAQLSGPDSDWTPVEDCMQNIVCRLRFPEPRGGGLVVVTYPFILQQSSRHTHDQGEDPSPRTSPLGQGCCLCPVWP